MKLVGATNAFIRRPFLVEGMLQGIIGGSAAILALYLIFEVAIVYYVPQAAVLSWPYGSIYWMAGGVMLLWVLLGWWGSRLAAREFIKRAEGHEEGVRGVRTGGRRSGLPGMGVAGGYC